MAAWHFTPTDLLFPIAVAALWGAIFLLMVYISRFAAHEHDSEAEEQETAVQEALSHSSSPASSSPASSSPATPPLPA